MAARNFERRAQMVVTPREPRETGRDYALRVIKDNIIRLELIPGSMMSEKELANELGLSRTPVREALLELSKVKIVEIYPQRGTTVALIDYALAEEAVFMRNVLECAVARLVCQTATAEDLQELEDNIRLQNFYLENPVPDKLLELDNEFHRRLFSICGKTQVYEMMNSITVHLDRLRNMSVLSVNSARNVGDHEDILAAIREKAPEKAESLVKTHLSRYKIDEEAIRQKYPNFF